MKPSVQSLAAPSHSATHPPTQPDEPVEDRSGYRGPWVHYPRAFQRVMRGLVKTPSCRCSGYGGCILWQNGSWEVLCSVLVSSACSNDPIHGMKCTPQNTYDVISNASMYGDQSRLASIFAKNPQRRSQNPGTRFRRSTKFCETKSTCYAQTVRVDPKKSIYFSKKCLSFE